MIRPPHRSTLFPYTTLFRSSDNTAPDTEAIYTDEMPAYWGIEDADTKHRWVNHSAEEWVVGDVHTNGIESVWRDRKSTRLNSSHTVISYAVFCLKKKNSKKN